jgi:hypothetical protein
MNINVNVKRKFKINGKEYDSIEEMPGDIREKFEKAMASQLILRDQTNSGTTQTKIVVNGIEYQSIDAMPQDVRQLYEKALKAAETGEVGSLGNSSGILTESKNFGTIRPADFQDRTKPQSTFSPRKFIVTALLIALIILLYFLYQNK